MVAINNLTKEIRKNDEEFLLKVAKKILTKEKFTAKTDLSIALVSEDEIKKLNLIYRNKNCATDVLSFGKLDKKQSEIKYFSEPEVIICPVEVKKNAESAKEPFKKELARVLVHAMLHLLGFEHENGGKKAEEMFQKQEDYLSLFDF
jgi:probable rRNA maturation factor